MLQITPGWSEKDSLLIVLGGNKPSEVARARRHHPRGRRLRSAARSIPPLHQVPEQSAHNATGGVMPMQAHVLRSAAQEPDSTRQMKWL